MSRRMKAWIVGVACLSLVSVSQVWGQETEKAKKEEPAASTTEAKPVELAIEKIVLKNCTGAQLRQLGDVVATLSPKAKGEVRVLRLAVDDTSNTIVARGTAAELAELAALVKYLDLPCEELKTAKIQRVHLVPLGAEATGRVQGILEQLGIEPSATISLSKATVLVFADKGKETDDLVKALETTVAAKAEAGTDAAK